MSTPAIPRGSRPELSLGQIAFGVLLVLFGAGWLLDATDVWHISWGAALPVALIAVGAVLVLGSATRGHGGLVALGVILTVILAFTTMLNVPLGGQVGDIVAHPTSIATVQTEYQVALGNQTVDLRDLTIPAGATQVTASTGVGQLTVNVPANVGLRVHFTVGAGSAVMLGKEYSGASIDETFTSSNYGSAAQKLNLELAMGLGTIEVR